MARLNSPDGFVSEVNIKSQSGVKRLKADKDGKYGTNDSSVIATLKKQGFTEESLNHYRSGDSSRGFNCFECGFASWFKKCSRCGHESPGSLTDGGTSGNSGTN